MGVGWLRTEWFAEARRRATELPPLVGLHYGVQFATPDGVVWHERVEDGHLVSWDLGPIQEPDAAFVVTDDLASKFYRPDLDGTACLDAMRVVLDDGPPRRPAPMDITETGALEALPRLVGADLRAQYHLAGGPFGPVDFWWVFEDGRSHATELGTLDAPDVEVWTSFPKVVRMRAGEMSVLEVLEHGGRVEGELGPLMLLGGIHESPEMRAADAACGPSGRPLAAMGTFRASEAVQALLDGMTAVT